MIQWEVFRDKDGKAHLAPVLPDGQLQANHALHEYCQCGPKLEKLDADGHPLEIYVHKDLRAPMV